MSVEVEGAAVDTTTRTSKHYDKMKQKTVAVNSWSERINWEQTRVVALQSVLMR